MPDFKIPVPNMTGDADKDVQSLYQAFLAQRKLLEYLLYNLDDSNILSVDAAKIKNLEAHTVVSQVVITETLTAEKGYIAELTVDQIDTSDKIRNYLASDTSDIKYRKIFDEEVQVIVGTTDGAQTEQATDRKGTLLYWTDETHVGWTYDDTGFPILQYVYDELIKEREYFEYDATLDIYYPKKSYGAGVGNTEYPDWGKGFLYKDDVGIVLEYIKSNGELIQIRLGENGKEGFSNGSDVMVSDDEPDSAVAGTVFFKKNDFSLEDVQYFTAAGSIEVSEGRIIDCNGTFDITPFSLAAEGAKSVHDQPAFQLILVNSGPGTVTYRPDLVGETVDGAATLAIPSGSKVKVWGYGTDWKVI